MRILSDFSQADSGLRGYSCTPLIEHTFPTDTETPVEHEFDSEFSSFYHLKLLLMHFSCTTNWGRAIDRKIIETNV